MVVFCAPNSDLYFTLYIFMSNVRYRREKAWKIKIFESIK